jgi:VWFA-related protein
MAGPGEPARTWGSAPLFAALFACCAPICTAFAQGGNPPTVIRAESRLVVVDAMVRDKKGKSVDDLAAGDFRIREDGKERPIASLSREGGASGPTGPQYVLFLFDATAGPYLALPGPLSKRIRQNVADVAGAYADPMRYMAVANFNDGLSIAQNFTSQADKVQRAALDLSLIPRADFRAPTITQMAGVQNQGGSSASSRVPPMNTNTAYPPLGAMGNAVQMATQRMQAAPALEAVRALADAMAPIHGRKAIVWLGGNDSSERETGTGDTAHRCNRAGVALYVTSDALKFLAEETGGRRIEGNDPAAALGGVFDDEQKLYALSFTPVESPDGSCHKLRVETVRAGLQVTARGVYCNVKPPDALAGKVEGKALEASASAPGAGRAAASLELPYFYDSPGVALVDLAMEMDLAGLKFAKVNGKEHADLNLVGLAYGADGEVAGRFSDTIPLDFDGAQQADTFRKEAYHYERQFRLPPGSYNVRVAFGSGDQSYGKAEAPLNIEAWDGKALALSGIALADEATKAEELTADLDPSLLEGHKDLIAKAARISPSADNRFHSSGPCFAYFEVYNPTVVGTMELRILAPGASVPNVIATIPLADYIRAGSAIAPVIVKVPLDSLPPGPYTVEVRATGAFGAVVTQSARFQVE